MKDDGEVGPVGHRRGDFAERSHCGATGLGQGKGGRVEELGDRLIRVGSGVCAPDGLSDILEKEAHPNGGNQGSQPGSPPEGSVGHVVDGDP